MTRYAKKRIIVFSFAVLLLGLFNVVFQNGGGTKVAKAATQITGAYTITTGGDYELTGTQTEITGHIDIAPTSDNQEITLDLKGKTLSANSGNAYTIKVNNGSKNTKLHIEGTGVVKNSGSNYTDCAIDIQAEATSVYVDGVTIESAGGRGISVNSNDSEVILDGGIIKGANGTNSYGVVLTAGTGNRGNKFIMKNDGAIIDFGKAIAAECAGATVIIDSGTIDCNNLNNSIGILVTNSGQVTINNVAIQNCAKGVVLENATTGNQSFTMKGGTITGNDRSLCEK